MVNKFLKWFFKDDEYSEMKKYIFMGVGWIISFVCTFVFLDWLCSWLGLIN